MKQQRHHSRTEGDIFYVSLLGALSVCCAAETRPAAGRRCKPRKVMFLEVTLYRLICEDSIWRVHIHLPVQGRLPLYGVDAPAVMGSQCMSSEFKHALFLKENEQSVTFNKFFVAKIDGYLSNNTCCHEEKWWSDSFT